MNYTAWYIQQRNRKRRKAQASAKLAVSDNFNRANGSLGANWTSPVGSFGTGLTGAEGTLRIVSNSVRTLTDDTHCFALWSANTFTDNQYSQIRIMNTGAWTGVILRAQFGLDRYYMGFVFAPNDYRLYARWDGAYYSYATGTAVTWVVGDIMKCTITGSVAPLTMKMYRNGAVVLTTTFPTPAEVKTGGSPGIGIYSPVGLNLLTDDWTGGNL